ncbi:MAG: transposase [Calditrichaeota bacterium]|nr:MAG: transposase [Calditrichota bacterium]
MTICSIGHQNLFGEIQKDEMILSKIGEIVSEEWYKSFEIRSELFCEAFVVMPNHIHGILRILQNEKTHRRASLQKEIGVAYRAPKSISSFVAGFKSSATKKINRHRNSFGLAVWQTRFHDHIIRNPEELHRIKNYILENPKRWNKDKFYTP